MKVCVGLGELRDKVQYTHECFTMVGGTEGRGGNEVGWRDGKAASGVWREVVRVCREGTVGYSSRCSIPHTVHSILFPAHTAPGVARWSAFPVVHLHDGPFGRRFDAVLYWWPCNGLLVLGNTRWSRASEVVLLARGGPRCWSCCHCCIGLGGARLSEVAVACVVVFCGLLCCVVWCDVVWCGVVWFGGVVAVLCDTVL